MTRYALNLPLDLKREAEEIAKKQGVSLNQFIMWSVSEKVATMRQQLDDPKFPGITYRRGSASNYAVPVIRGTGIRVQTIAVAIEELKETPEYLAENYPISISQVREALAFYHAHREEIDENIKYENDLEEEYKNQRNLASVK
ncbi:MAG: DUF433 domain-containing protein [Chloroflexota bacterium]